MSYKTILVHTDLSFAADDRVRFAARLARRFGAHLAGHALAGTSRHLDPAAEAAVRTARAARRHTLRDDAGMALQRFMGIVRDEDVPSSEARLVDDAVEGGLAMQGRYCDLLVVGQPDRTQWAPAVPADLPVRLALTTGRPVLAIPCAGWRAAPGGDALVAWDGSLEAARAVTAALPLLALAQRVTILAVADTPAPTGWLARHGVEARVRLARQAVDPGAALAAEAEDSGAGLLVAGAGPAAASLLRAMTVPVLLAG